MTHQTHLGQLEPVEVWQHFKALSQIPRGSGQEHKAIAFIESMAQRLNLDHETDHAGNVIIRKPASAGMETCRTVALQSHLDMVQEKANGVDFNFKTDPLDLIIEGDWVRANGTTLGADNGIGVSLALAVLASKDLCHPAIEALFTVDEEEGMSGAEAVTPSQLSAHWMINLDMESDQELTIGCAGSIDILVNGDYETQPLCNTLLHYKLSVSGGKGGHSGLDIHLNRMNGIQTLASVLLRIQASINITVCSFHGGSAANVIPHEAVTQFAVPADKKSTLEALLAAKFGEPLSAFTSDEPAVSINCQAIESALHHGFSAAFQVAFLEALTGLRTGVHSFCSNVGNRSEDVVETSMNLAIVRASNSSMMVHCLARSCIESHKPKLVEQVQQRFANTGAIVSIAADQPGWEPNAKSALVSLMADVYQQTNGEEPKITTIHAGLECGIIAATFPHMDMVSYGPIIQGAHTPQERVQISSVNKVWTLLSNVLARIPRG